MDRLEQARAEYDGQFTDSELFAMFSLGGFFTDLLGNKLDGPGAPGMAWDDTEWGRRVPMIGDNAKPHRGGEQVTEAQRGRLVAYRIKLMVETGRPTSDDNLTWQDIAGLEL